MRVAVLVSLGAIVMALGGCASPDMSMRSEPPEHPAAENAAVAQSAAAFASAAATASASQADQEAGQPEEQAPPVTPAEAPPMVTYDPWERLNRFTYRFNARFDEAIYLPVANAYRRVPSPLRSGVHNFFGNLGEVDSVINYALQWRLRFGVRSLGRFLINSTMGLGGLFDVAKKLDLPGAPTGFATTLSKWGMHPGPFLIIPFLGPSTLRDSVGFLGDYGTSYGVNIGGLYRGDESWALGGVNAVDQRSNINFRYYSTGSPFEYGTVRFLFVRKRLIEDEALHAKDHGKRPSATAPAGK